MTYLSSLGLGVSSVGTSSKSCAKMALKKIRAVDQKPILEWYAVFDDAENLSLDLKKREACHTATKGAASVYNLAADMGGMGFIELNKAACMLSVLINTHLLLAAQQAGARRFLFASSACVYNAEKQVDSNVTALKEEDAYPALPEDGMVGRNCSASGCVVTSAKTSV
jgi:GDP-D-mannose 3',5'-epimerase